MKKLLALPLFLAALLTGCDEAKSGPFSVFNETDSDLNVIISANEHNDIVRTIKTQEQFDTGIYYNVPTIKVIKSLDDRENDSNRYKTVRNSFTTTISEIPPHRFPITINIPAAVFENAEEPLYLYERNGKFNEWTGDDEIKYEIKRVPITATDNNGDTIILSTTKVVALSPDGAEVSFITAYTAKPELFLSSDKTNSEAEGTFNGVGVSAKIEDGKILVN